MTHSALSDEELIKLDELLSASEDEALGIDEAHGYLSALIVRDMQIDQAEWLEQIIEEHDKHPETIGLLIRLHEEIKTSLQNSARFEPMIIEEEIDGEICEAYEGWCFGFMLGVTQHQTLWDELPSNKEELLAPIAQLALLYSEEEIDLSEDEYEDCVELIPGAVSSLYEHWHQ